jgi:glyoxylase-like metal-dependent hydrolase (beta-lactamase superfamily II)
MSRTLLVRLSAGLLALAGAWVAYTQTKQGPPQLTLNKIKDDLYEIEGDGGNVAVYITNEGVIMVDDKFEQDSQQIIDKVKSVTNQPIKYILSTHYHQDHSGGNTNFSKLAEIISTVNAHNSIVNHVQSNAANPEKMIAARVTFTEETDLFLGGKEVRAHHFGRGHTNGDAMVYFPALRVLHTGDLFTSALPLIDYPGGGSLVEWPKTLDKAMAFWDFDTVIPGHGAVTNKAALMAYRTNADALRTKIQQQVRSGKTEAQVKQFMKDEYKWADNSLNMQWGFPGLMNELK